MWHPWRGASCCSSAALWSTLCCPTSRSALPSPPGASERAAPLTHERLGRVSEGKWILVPSSRGTAKRAVLPDFTHCIALQPVSAVHEVVPGGC